MQIPRSVSSNRSRSPTPHQTTRHHGEDTKKTGNRSRSPTPQRKHLSNPVHQPSDAGKLRSRSPTPKTNSRSRSPTPKVENGKASDPMILDPTRKALNEEIRQVKYDGRSQMYHSRHQDNYQVRFFYHSSIQSTLNLNTSNLQNLEPSRCLLLVGSVFKVQFQTQVKFLK